jgi:Ca-activated chloride channel homolog
VKFSHPGWLAAGFIAAIALIWLWRRYDARQQAALAKFVSAHLRQQLTRSISLTKRRLQRGLVLAALLLLFAALAGPLIGFRWQQVSSRGNEIIFAIDTSRSMSAGDVKPSRLARAKLAIDDFIRKLDGDAAGLVAFAGTAFLVCPMTLDYAAFHESLAAVDTNTIPRGGTNISSAIQAAQAALHRRPSSDKILILITDGEDLEGDALAAARAAAQSDGLKIYTIGVGTAAGDLIPIPLEQGGGFVKDDSGAFVKSRLDESALKAIASATGGFYVPLGTQGEGLETVFKSALGSAAKHDLAFRQQKIYTERYQWPLAGSLVALLTSLLIGSRKRRRIRGAAAAAATAVAGLGYLAILPLQPVRAADQSPQEAYNAGTAQYRASQYPQAAQSFQQSINRAPSGDVKRLADQEDAYYNLGNTLYRTGQKTEQSAPQETIQKWTEAVKAYETALQLRADDADSKYNRDLVQRKLNALKQNQNQSQNQSQNQNKDQNQNQNKSQGNGSGGQQPDQQQGKPPPQNGQPPSGAADRGQPPPQANAPPPKPDDSKGSPPPPKNGQPQNSQPQNGQPQNGQPQNGQPQNDGDTKSQPPTAGAGEPQKAGEEASAGDNQRLPGQMTREEARELLDSAKGDEHHSLGVPIGNRNPNIPADQPYKNW